MRSAAKDALVGILGFWAIVSLVYLTGRWYLPPEFPGRLIDRAAAQAPVDDPTLTPGDQTGLLRGQLATLGAPGAAVAIGGAIEVHDILTSVEPLADPCPGCMAQAFGEPREIRTGDPVQVGVRLWKGTTVLSITAASAPIDQPVTDLRVSLNAGGKVFFGRECTLTMEQSEHAVYVVAVEGESGELLEARSFAGRLECGILENSTTGEVVTLAAVFSYAAPQVGH